MLPAPDERCARVVGGAGRSAAVAAALALAVVGLATPGVTAIGPSTWVQASYEDFRAGDLDGVSVTRSGEVRLAPELVVLRDSFPTSARRAAASGAGAAAAGEQLAAEQESTPYVWAIDRAVNGTWYAAVGSDGDLYRMRPGEDPQWLFAVRGNVHALVIGPDDHVYVSMSPSGAVLRVPPDYVGGRLPPWFEPAERYSWALAFGHDGRLFVGTGLEGRIYAVDAAGEGEVFYDSSDAHVTALTVDGAGNLIAGTDGSGHVYRISPAGDVFVLYDAPLRQITGLVSTDLGIFVAAMDEPSTGAASGAEPTSSSSASTASPASGNLAGAVYLIRPDGYTELVWSSETESAHSLVAYDGGVVVGTGSEGRLYLIDAALEVAILQRVDAAQVTGMRAAGEELLVATANLGKVYRLRRDHGPSGALVSQVKDTGTTSSWGRLRWRGRTPEGTAIRLFTRTGNTEVPDDTWSDWSAPYTDSSGSAVTSERARFIQWKAELTTEDPARTPVLQWVEMVYVQRNLRPDIGQFTVHPGGVVYRPTSSFEDSLPFGQVPAPLAQELARLQGRDPAASSASTAGSAFLGRPFFVPGSQTISWQASDPNGDRLVYSLAYRGERESVWKPIVDDLEGSMYTWDTTTVPDGLYVLRVVASDAPSNPLGEELVARRSSEPFVVDNTPPVVGELESTAAEGAVRLRGEVTDAVSLIRQIEYAVDGGSWRTVLPADGLADSGREVVDLRIENLAPGEHTVVVRATDTAFNRGSNKAVVSVR